MTKRMLLSLGVLLVITGCATTQPVSQEAAPVPPTSSSPAPSAKAFAANPASYVPRGTDYTTAPDKIAFGSCANQDQPQPIWKSIIKAEPDLFLFMGDNIYATGEGQQPIREQYRKLDRIPEYREAREKIPFMAAWDDGDLGTRDGGADAPTLAEARRDFLNYWVYLRNSLPEGRQGVYHSKTMGGLVTGRRRKKVNGPAVNVIVLDTRTFRSPLNSEVDATTGKKRDLPSTDPKAKLLGEAQWEWLERELKAPADLRIVVSSIQLIGSENDFEKWANYPKERERFFQLLQKTKAKNVVVFSGDRHMGSIARTEVKGWGTLYDITSSALNRPATVPAEKDKDYIAPSYTQENFGLAEIDWKKRTMKVELKDLQGASIQSVDIKIR